MNITNAEERKIYDRLQSINLDTTIKIVSPNIKIDRFFQNEDPTIIINELISLSKTDSYDTSFVFPEWVDRVAIENYILK